jgi:hypothetical protein
MTINGDSRQILFQHPPSTIVYHQVSIPDRSALSLGIGLDPQVWSPQMGDGIEFKVLVQPSATHPVQVFDQYLDPKHEPADRRWLDTRIDLGRFAGKTVDIHFVTLPGSAGNEDYDWGGWSTPVLIAAQAPVGIDEPPAITSATGTRQ